MSISLKFDRGTLILEGLPAEAASSLGIFVWDERTLQHRAPAHRYRETVLGLKAQGVSFNDLARAYEFQCFPLIQPIEPRTHQAEALAAWEGHGRVGCVSLPTGAGKTILAVLAIARAERPALIVVPTIDLMQQWFEVLQKFFGGKIGLLGGGYHDLQPLTVATYDSSHIHIDSLGPRFGLLIFDECHHLPAPQYQSIAMMALAPYRLGLSATIERPDGREALIYELLGKLVYRAHIHELSANTLSPYDIITKEVEMSTEEWESYQHHRGIYRDFIRAERINFQSPTGWKDFIIRSSRSPAGRQAMKSYLSQRRLAQGSSTKLTELWQILRQHSGERILIFTNDNAFAYQIGREFLLPVLTHQTRTKERVAMLAAFRGGELKVLATSRVLNEGVDVPEASVAVVLSGGAGVREHVQRLGRILRHRAGKQALMYEVISKDTHEFFVNRRRRQHDAYQRSGQGQDQGSAALPEPD